MSASVPCLGCGQNLEEVSYTRLLKSEASRHIIPLWTYILSQELQGERVISGINLVNRGGKICRTCFSAYDRCTKLMDTLRSSISQVAELLQDSCTVEDPVIALEPPAPKRVAVCSEPCSASPAVLVII